MLVSFISVCMLLLFSITAYAVSPVTPKTSFDYRGTDTEASLVSQYRDSKAFFRDEAEILTGKQQEEIWEKLQAVTDDMDIKVAVFLGGNYRSDPETEDFAHDCAVSLFGNDSDSLFIYLDFEGHSPAYDYIRALNKAERIFNKAAIDDIFDVMYEYLPPSDEPVYSDDVKKALLMGMDEVNELYGKSTDQPNGAFSASSTQNGSGQKISIDINKIYSLITGMGTFSILVIAGIAVFVIYILLLVLLPKRSGSSDSSYYDRDRYYRSSYSSSRRRHSSRSHGSSSRSSSHSSRSGGSGSGRHR